MISTTENIAGQIAEWTGGQRLFSHLTKAELWARPIANPAEEMAMTIELVAREEGWLTLKDEAAKAEERLGWAKVRMTDAREMLRLTEHNLDKAKVKGNAPAIAECQGKLVLAQANDKAARKNLDDRTAQAAAAREALTGIAANDQAVSDQEVRDYYRRRYASAWESILSDFNKAEYLRAQRYGWVSFLMCEPKERTADEKAFQHAQSMAMLVGEEEGRVMNQLRLLYRVRVEPNLASRRKYLDEDGTKRVANLKPEQQVEYWRKWRAYNTATVVNQWVDESNVAYDDRQFKVGMLMEFEVEQ